MNCDQSKSHKIIVITVPQLCFSTVEVKEISGNGSPNLKASQQTKFSRAAKTQMGLISQPTTVRRISLISASGDLLLLA